MLGRNIELLGALPIFRGLSRKQLFGILDVAEKVYFESGDILVTRNRIGDTAYLILTGAARCLDFPGNPAACERIEPGSLVAELAMLSGIVHALTVEARGRVRALALRREAMNWLMRQDPSIAAQISDNLLLRLQSFARDLRRLDAFLAHIEGEAPISYGIHVALEPPLAAAFPHLAQHPPIQGRLQRR